VIANAAHWGHLHSGLPWGSIFRRIQFICWYRLTNCNQIQHANPCVFIYYPHPISLGQGPIALRFFGSPCLYPYHSAWVTTFGTAYKEGMFLQSCIPPQLKEGTPALPIFCDPRAYDRDGMRTRNQILPDDHTTWGASLMGSTMPPLVTRPLGARNICDPSM